MALTRQGPNPFAMRQNMQNYQNLAKIKKLKQQSDVIVDIEQDEQEDGFKLYPLTPGTNPKMNRQNRMAMPVQPLPQPRFNNAPPLPQSANGHLRQPMQIPMPPMNAPQQPMSAPPRQPQFSPPQPAQPPAPIPPERAADQFRRINNGLPDGVRYEPLDEETMRLLKDNGHLPDVPNQPAAQNPPVQQATLAPPTLTPARTPMIPPDTNTFPSVESAMPTQKPSPPSLSPIILSGEIPKILESLAQDERNAQVFYGKVSESAGDDIKEMLSSLSRDCGARLNQYLSILSTHCNRRFVPLETAINTNIEVNQALALAIAEENKSLATLNRLLDQVSDTSAEMAVQRIVNKKMVGHQLLLGLSVNLSES